MQLIKFILILSNVIESVSTFVIEGQFIRRILENNPKKLEKMEIVFQQDGTPPLLYQLVRNHSSIDPIEWSARYHIQKQLFFEFFVLVSTDNSENVGSKNAFVLINPMNELLYCHYWDSKIDQWHQNCPYSFEFHTKMLEFDFVIN